MSKRITLILALVFGALTYAFAGSTPTEPLEAYDPLSVEEIGEVFLPELEMTTAQNLVELAIRFFVNLLICWIIVKCFYYRKSRRTDYFFTFMIFSTAMLMMLYIMGNVQVGIGLTLGMFAIFGVIRYRTETVPIREMTYLFVIIALAAVNGLAPLYEVRGLQSSAPHYELDWGGVVLMVLANLIVVLLILLLESKLIWKPASTKSVVYDRVDLIVPEKKAELFADLEGRLGVKVRSVTVESVDFIRDSAMIKVYYTE